MRILMVGSTRVDSGDVVLLLMQSFDRQGWQVDLLSTSEDLPFWASVGDALNRKEIRVLAFSRYLFAKAVEWKPDIVYIHGSNTWVLPETIRELKRTLGCQMILWELNNSFYRGHEAECLPLYDHVFVLDSYMIPVLRVAGAQNVHHLSACADPKEHFPMDLSPSDQLRYGADICFIGSAYAERTKLLSQLVDYNLRVYGAGWESVDPALAHCVWREPVLDSTKVKIFSASRMSINLHGSHMINGENFRVFEVAACRRVSFSAYKSDLVQLLEPGSEVILFEDVGDLRAKIDYYLAHPDELEAIGSAARQRVLAEHTYDHRAQTIMRHVEDRC